MIGVAISTTGDEHRMKFLETAVAKWCEIPDLHSLFVTVDGDTAALNRVARAVDDHTGSVYRVGQGVRNFDGHQGVAVNKNTGLELLIDGGRCTKLFLSDDDVWPRGPESIALHTEGASPHSMVCWGRHRLLNGKWTWPRGVVLYTEDHVIDAVGGMDEGFGPGGHEHVEWSRRIHQAGFTADPFETPDEYLRYGGMGAFTYWHAEDMPKKGEPLPQFRARKRRQTSVRTTRNDWVEIERLFIARDGDTSYVPFRAAANGRDAATMSSHNGA